MKSTVKLFLSFLMSLQLAGQSIASTENKELRTNLKQMQVNKMTLSELESALKELKARLAVVSDDLVEAQKLDNERVAIKVRNGAMGVGLAALAFELLEVSAKGNGDSMIKLLAVLVGGAAVVGFTQGYIYLTQFELRDLKKTVDVLNNKIELIQRKIGRRKAELNLH